jgi:predicted transcriptional regulator
MAGSTITVRTAPEIAEKLAVLAEAMQRSRNWVVDEALRQYIETQSWQVQGIQQAQTSLARGEGTPFADAMSNLRARLERKLREQQAAS